ncbi:FkbM family methyltransferase [Streptomyces rectiverticillatus]|uniref:FkbM family methyltransferase n=1 Tax=Streptomyces rectiverticillatus TaxID=173860 RepID=UPI0015C40D94|nr:FkbM family methyltransferase [Streptomyces rectiverticillatus]QLE73962.1 FkbM family methyltransferase [Streptomyces rectiverticillatus]
MVKLHTAESLVSLSRWYVRHAPGSFGKAPLAAQYLNPYLRDHPRRRVTRSRLGASFAVETQDLIQRYIYMFGVWEPHLTCWLSRRLRPGDAFVDVGANIGYFSVLASRLVGEEGCVVAVEASPAVHERGAAQARLNGCRNVRAVNTAVSDSPGALTFTLASSRNIGANSIVSYDGPAESRFEIQAKPLPEVLTAVEIAAARVIKVDVEGAEGSVVRGMVPLLDRLRPEAEIAIEVTPERMAQLGDSADELLATMREYGFHTYRIANDYAAASYPAALRRAPLAPVRWRGPVVGESDLIFSRVDAETLP